MKHIRISARTTQSGFTTTIGSRRIETIYPRKVWQSLPTPMKTLLAESAAYFFSHHVALTSVNTLIYQFPPPAGRLYMDYGYFYSMTEAPYEFPERKLTIPEVLRQVYNAEFSSRFTDIVRPQQFVPSPKLNRKSVLMPISFGKDSLLTFSVLREMGYEIHPIFFEEPTAPYHNLKKKDLREKFMSEFNVTVTPFPNTLGNLRQAGGMMWGWDMLLLQYTTLLLPYVYHFRPAYFFWSNEQSTNESARTEDGYRVNYTHEQSVSWTQNLTNLYRSFGINTTIGSLIEPLHELVILSILHKRYPQIGKYQLSCDGEKTKYRWCGKCFECARIYLFFSALGIDPTTVGLMDNMFDPKKREYFYLFSEKRHDLNIVFQSYPERLFAFYLAYKRGVRGGLMDEFEKKLLPVVIKQKHSLFKKYFSVHESYTIPQIFKPKLARIYGDELARLKKEFT